MGTFGNRVSVMIVPIPTDVADHARAAACSAHEMLQRGEDAPQGAAGDAPAGRDAVHPAGASTRARRAATMQLSAPACAPPLNLVISNVPGPADAALPGRRAAASRNFPVSVITDGVGLNITCLSYLDHVDFGIVVDREMVDDAWPLMDAMRDALDELDAAICGKR